MTGKTGVDLQKQWLVRKVANGISILGPFWTDQVRLMLEQGMLAAEDEICAENSFWFAIREVSEIKKHFGVDHVPVSQRAGEESTQPDLQIEEVTTDPHFESTGLIKVKRPSPTLAAAPVSADELASRFRRVSLSKYLGYGSPTSLSSSQLFGIEKGRFWSILFFSGVVLAIVGVIWVLKSLQV